MTANEIGPEQAITYFMESLRDKLVDRADVDPDAEARRLHAKLAADDAWARALPSLEDLARVQQHISRSARPGGSVWFDELMRALEKSLSPAFHDAAIGVPQVVLISRSSRIGTSSVLIKDVENGFAILVQESMPEFLNRTSRALASILPIDFGGRPYSEEEMAQVAFTNRQHDPMRSFGQFAEAAVYMASDGHTDRVEARSVEPERMPMVSHLWKTSELFMLGHEYAHFELGHHGSRTPALDALNAVHASTTRDQELQADELGLSLTSFAIADTPLEHVSMGAWAFLSSYMALELAVCTLVADSKADGLRRYQRLQARRSPDGHPSPLQRKAQLYHTLQQHAKGSEVLRSMWSSADVALGALMDYVADYARSGVAEGLRPSDRHWTEERVMAAAMG